MLVCAFGALLKEPLLSDYDMLNVHPSLLPRWRGAAPVERAIEAGDATTGVSIMRPTAELDAGPVHLMAEEPIAGDDSYGSLAPRLAAIGGELLVRALDTGARPSPQPDEGATYADKIEAADRLLDTSAARGGAGAAGARSAPAHRRLPRAGGRRAPARSARPRGRRPGRVRRPRATAACSRAISSCWRYSPPAAGPWTPPRGLEVMRHV